MDAGVAQIDIETKRMKEELRLKEVQARAVAEHGELALISVDGPKTETNERIPLRPPMLQVFSFPQQCMLLPQCCIASYVLFFRRFYFFFFFL